MRDRFLTCRKCMKGCGGIVEIDKAGRVSGVLLYAIVQIGVGRIIVGVNDTEFTTGRKGVIEEVTKAPVRLEAQRDCEAGFPRRLPLSER